MKCCNSIGKSPAAMMTKIRMDKSYLSQVGFSPSLRLSALQPVQRVHIRRRAQAVLLLVGANVESTSYGGMVSPHEPTSPEGKLLNYVLQNRRYFFQSAVSEQLSELVSIRNRAAAVNKKSSGSMESVLRTRIAELKEKERQTAIEDLIYMSIVHKFSEVGIPMVPKLSFCFSDNTHPIYPSKRRELESIHNVEVQKLIREHLGTILLGLRGESKIHKIQLGRIYAATILFGYFLMSASFRRNMDLSLACTDGDIRTVAEAYSYQTKTLATHGQRTDTPIRSSCQELRRCETLSYYVKSFDSKSLQRCAKLKSMEAVNVIERHTWALFGDEKIPELGCDGEVVIKCSSLERLMLEAVAFGSFLWEVERSVDSVYTLQRN